MDIAVVENAKYALIRLGGKIDWESARDLDSKIAQLIDKGNKHLVFDFDEVKFICSGGIGALVYNLKKIKRIDGGIYLITSNEYIKYIFETLKFDIIFHGCMFDTIEEFQDMFVSMGNVH